MKTETTPNSNDGISSMGKAIQQADDVSHQNRTLLIGFQKIQALLDRPGYISKTEVQAIILETMQNITS